MVRPLFLTKSLAAGAILLTTAAAFAAPPTMKPGHNMGSRPTVPASDRAFAMKAAQGGLTEVTLGKLASQRASNPQVKSFGSRMVTDHSKANQDLKQTAAREGIKLPAGMNAEQRAMQAKLSRLHGAAFDSAYVSDMVKDHQEDSAEFSKEASTGKDPGIKGFAARTLPVINMHLHMIQQIKSGMGKSSGGTMKGHSTMMGGHKM